jgi:excisionase family DNA binding protein
VSRWFEKACLELVEGLTTAACRRTVRRLAREGEIPAFKIGRQWRVKKDLLDRWIERETMRNIGEGDSAWGEGPGS